MSEALAAGEPLPEIDKDDLGKFLWKFYGNFMEIFMEIDKDDLGTFYDGVQ